MDDYDRLSDSQVMKMTNEIIETMQCCRQAVNSQLATERIQLLRENQALADEINSQRRSIAELEAQVKDERANSSSYQ